MGYLRWICVIIILLLTWIRRSSNRGVGQAQTSHYQQTRKAVGQVPVDPQDDLLREQDVGPEEIALVVVNASAEALVRYFEMPWWKRLRPNREWAYTMAKTAQVQSVELVQFNLRRRGLVPDEGPVDS